MENIGSALKSIISRYGELKTSPTTLVDAEGEALSFNKVDTALQSVGITMKTTSGQFRDFDDVILDLSKKWQTLDKNTQRYIATVMAGNRQQSRFIALVDNYSRLSELTEEAANAQDAGTLQYLKTLDSIESKLNQVQVAFQQFYTSMGLETVFKGALDTATAFINTLNSLPKIFDKIPAAALSMGASLIIAVKHIIKLLAVPLYTELKKLKQQIGEVTGANYQIVIHLDKDTPKKEAQELKQELDAELNKKEPVKLSISETIKKNKGLITNLLGSTITAAGNIASVAALTRENTSSDTREWGKVNSGVSGLLGNVLGGAVSGSAAGPWGAVAGAVLGLVKSFGHITSLIDGIDYNLQEQIATLDKEIQTQKNKVAEQKNEVNTLEQAARKLEDLQKKRWESTEANQEYIEYMNSLGESHQELISYIDAEGNSVIELGKVYDSLINKRSALNKAELIQIQLEQRQLKLKQKEYEQATTDSTVQTEFKNTFTKDYDTNTVFNGINTLVEAFGGGTSNKITFQRDTFGSSLGFTENFELDESKLLPLLTEGSKISTSGLNFSLDKVLEYANNFNYSEVFDPSETNLLKVINAYLGERLEKVLATTIGKEKFPDLSKSIEREIEQISTTSDADYEQEVLTILLGYWEIIKNYDASILDQMTENEEFLAQQTGKQQKYFDALNKNSESLSSKEINTLQTSRIGLALFDENNVESINNVISFYNLYQSVLPEIESLLSNLSEYANLEQINEAIKNLLNENNFEYNPDDWNKILTGLNIPQQFEQAQEDIETQLRNFEQQYCVWILDEFKVGLLNINLGIRGELTNKLLQYAANQGNIDNGVRVSDAIYFLNNLFEDINSIEDIDIKNQIYEYLNSIDFSDIFTVFEAIDNIKKLKLQTSDSTNQQSIDEINDDLDKLAQTIPTTLLGAQTYYQDALLTLSKNGENTLKNLTEGFKNYEDAIENFDKLVALSEQDYSFNDLFKYDAALNKYIYTNLGATVALETSLNTESKKLEKAAQVMQDMEDEDADILQELERQKVIEYTNLLYDYINSLDWKKILEKGAFSEITSTVLNELGSNTGIDLSSFEQSILNGGKEALNAYANVIGDAFDIETAKLLYQGNGILAQVSAIASILDLKVGDMIDAGTARLAGLKVDEGQNYYLVESAEELLAAVNATYDEIIKNFNEGTASLTDVLDIRNKLLEANLKNEKAVEAAMQKPSDLSINEITALEEAIGEQIVDEYGNIADQYVKYFSRTGLESWAVTDITIFDKVSITDEMNSYLVEARQIATRALGENIVDLAKKISESSEGDVINVKNLPQEIQQALNAHEGVLTIVAGEQATLINALLNSSTDALATLPQGMAQVADILTEYYNAIISLTEGGIGGTLSEVDKQKLVDAANGQGLQLTDDDFTKTLKGYKLTTDAALKLQAITKGTTYSTLIESLIETDDKYKTIQDTLRTQKQLEDQLAEARAKQDDAEIQALDKQLQLTRDIVQTQSLKNTSSYDFMNRNNEFFGAPTNYFSSIDTALDKWKEFQQGKLLDPQDLENILIELNNIVARGGQNLKIAGVELDGGAEAVTNAFAEMMKGLTISSDGIGVSLTKLGANFDFGIDDLTTAFEGGIKTLAEENIKMLDSIISMLEMVQALENIEVSDNPQEFLENVFGLYQNMPDEAKEIFDETQLTLKTGTKSIKEWIDEFSTGNYDKDDLTLFANFFTKLQQIPEDFDWSSMTLGQFTSWLQGVAEDCNNVATAAEDATDRIKKLAKAGNSILTPDEEKQLADNKEQSDIKFSPNTILKAKQARQKRDGVVANPYNGPGSEFDIIGSDFSGPKEEEKEKETPPVVTEVTIQYSPDTPAGLKFLVESLDTNEPIRKTVDFFLSSPELENTESPYATLLDNALLLRQIILSAATSQDEETKKTFADLSQEQWFQELLITAGLTNENITGLNYNSETGGWSIETINGTQINLDKATLQGLQALGLDTNWNIINGITGSEVSVKDIEVTGLSYNQENGWTLTGEVGGEEVALTFNPDTITGLTYNTNTSTWTLGTVAGDLDITPLSDEEIASLGIPQEILQVIPQLQSIPDGELFWDGKTLRFTGTIDGQSISFTADWDAENGNTPQTLLDTFKDVGIEFTVTAPTADAQIELDNFIEENKDKSITVPIKTANGTNDNSQNNNIINATPAEEIADTIGDKFTKEELDAFLETSKQTETYQKCYQQRKEEVETQEQVTEAEQEEEKVVNNLNKKFGDAENVLSLFINSMATHMPFQGSEEDQAFVDLFSNNMDLLLQLQNAYFDLRNNGSVNTESKFSGLNGASILREPSMLKDIDLFIDRILANVPDYTIEYDDQYKGLNLSEIGQGIEAADEASQDYSTTVDSAADDIENSSNIIAAANQNEANSANNASANINRLSNNSNTVTHGFNALRAASQNTQNEFNQISTVLPRVIEKLEIIANTNPNGESGGVTGKILNPGRAKGNVALAQGTLMGELGPELFVTGGHYYIAGQSGAEFVNLPDDAIVFNHLQTARLMGSGHTGRGKAVTNEHKATSMATGTPKGEAKASVSDTLSKLYDLRAMWQAILDLGSQDLGKLAGGSGGGGGKEQAAINKEIERWYNLLRQIANLEKQITLEQQKRNNLVHGGEIYNSYRKELDMLEAELKRQKELNALQKDWYDRKREDLATSEIGKYIFTYDENGLMQYRDGRNLGLDILENLTRVDANENAVDEMDTAKKQLQYLESIGFDISTLAGDDEGAKVQDFFSKIDAQMKEMDSLWDEFVDGQNSVEKLVEKQNNILETIQKNQIDLENKILDSIVERQQQLIDTAQAERDAISDSNQRFLNGLSEQLSKERELYDRNEDDEELRKLQRQLAILQRSGGSSSQIRSLQEQITNRQQERYFQAQQDQIDAVQEASDLEIDRLDRQINLMTETLEYQKENGLFWGEVTELLSTSPENIAQFIAAYNPDFAANSATANAVEFADLIKMAQIYVADREEGNRKLNETNAWEAYSGNLSSKYFASGGILDTSSPMGQRHLDSLEERYRAAYLAESGKYEDFNDNPQAQAAAAQAGVKAAEAYLKTLLEDEKTANAVAASISSTNGSNSSGNGSSNSETGSNTAEISQLKTELAAKEKELSNLTGVINSIQGNVNYWASEREKYERALIQAESIGDYNAAAKASVNIETVRKKWLEQRDLYTSYVRKRNSIELEIDDIKGRLKELGVPGYKQGGLVDYTGPAIVHGSKAHPEGFLSADALEQLRNTMLTSIDLNDSIVALQNGLNRSVNNIRNINNTNSTDGVYIDNLTLQLNPGTISSDYDARRAADMVMEEVMKIASKSGVRSVSRR